MSVATMAPATPLVLRDGTAVEVRAMQPSDTDRLRRFHGTLSPETTYLRFFSFHPELSAQEVHRFTHVDHRDREAVVAVAAGEIVAVGRFDREPDGASAEVAFVVADAWQGRGLGSVLFAHLADQARDIGIERFTAQTLAHNHRMLRVFQRSGHPVTTRTAGGVVDVQVDLLRPRAASPRPAVFAHPGRDLRGPQSGTFDPGRVARIDRPSHR